MTRASIPKPDTDLRIWSFERDGRRFWAKRRERLGLRMRLQKGNPEKGFRNEREAIRTLWAEGVPVGPIVAEDEECFVTPDHGPTVAALLRSGDASLPEALVAAAEALADLHGRGLTHGRPCLKDICWDGAEIRFIDLERYSPDRNTRKGRAWDVIYFVFNGIAEARGDTPELASARAAYRASDQRGTWADAARIARRLWLLSIATWPVRKLVPHAAEFQALPLTLQAMAAG